mgnify:CR=1 FL=1
MPVDVHLNEFRARYFQCTPLNRVRKFISFQPFLFLEKAMDPLYQDTEQRVQLPPLSVKYCTGSPYVVITDYLVTMTYFPSLMTTTGGTTRPHENTELHLYYSFYHTEIFYKGREISTKHGHRIEGQPN